MTAHKNAAAFFDLDGTLLAPPSLERRFAGEMIRRGEIGFRASARWLGRIVRLVLEDAELEIPRDTGNRSQSQDGRAEKRRGNPPIAWGEVAAEDKTYLRGLRVSLLEEWIAQQEFVSLGAFPAALARIAWHAAQGHQMFLVTGTLAPLARCVAQKLTQNLAPGTKVGALATELGTANGCFTGEISGPAMTGEEKLRAVALLAAASRLELSHSYAYGNSLADLPMLECVGQAHAVNPSFALAWAARRRNWPVLLWDADGLRGNNATGDPDPAMRRAHFAAGRRP